MAEIEIQKSVIAKVRDSVFDNPIFSIAVGAMLGATAGLLKERRRKTIAVSAIIGATIGFGIYVVNFSPIFNKLINKFYRGHIWS